MSSHLHDTVGVMEAHFDIIEKEIQEIDKDVCHIEECTKKYGDVFTAPLGHLYRLREEKKALLSEILRRLESAYERLRASD